MCAGRARSPPRPAPSDRQFNNTDMVDGYAGWARSCSPSCGRRSTRSAVRRHRRLLPRRHPGAAREVPDVHGWPSSRPSRRCSPADGGHAPHRGRRHRVRPPLLDRGRLDEVIAVPEAEAFAMARRPRGRGHLLRAVDRREPGGRGRGRQRLGPGRRVVTVAGRQRAEVPRRRPLRLNQARAGDHPVATGALRRVQGLVGDGDQLADGAGVRRMLAVPTETVTGSATSSLTAIGVAATVARIRSPICTARSG